MIIQTIVDMMIIPTIVDMMIILRVLSNGQVNSSFLRVHTNGHLKKSMANMQILE